ncbi:MAG TPA: hypothetical protein VKA06_07465, partial [Spirochaetia bacterium]|nr:hypothetical protein [Spirochaetia bacterium]
GQAEIQAACHAMEASLGAEKSGSLTPEVLQDGLHLVDVLRACARGESADSHRAELARLASSATGRAAGMRAAAGGPEDTGVAHPARSGHAGGQTGTLSVDDLRTLVRHFAPLWRADQRLSALVSPGDVSARCAALQDMGLAVLDYLDALPDSLSWYRSVGRYLEHALNLVIMSGFDYDPARFDLLHTFVLDMEQGIRTEFVRAACVESVLLDDPDSIGILPDALAALSEPSIVAISIRMPFERLARAGRTLEAIREAAADPRHTVFFVIDDAGETERLTRSLADVLGGFPVIGTSIWEGLLNALAPEV